MNTTFDSSDLDNYRRIAQRTVAAFGNIGAAPDTALFGIKGVVARTDDEPDLIRLGAIELAKEYLDKVADEESLTISEGNAGMFSADGDPDGHLDVAINSLSVGSVEPAIDALKKAIVLCKQTVVEPTEGRNRADRRHRAELQRKRLLLASRVSLTLLAAAGLKEAQ